MTENKMSYKDWQIIALIAAVFSMFVGLMVYAGSLEQGAPTRVTLTASGCDFVEAAGMVIETRRAEACTVRGYFHRFVFGNGALLDQGRGNTVQLGAAAIVGYLPDETLLTPKRKEQVIALWAAGIFWTIALGLIIFASVPRRKG